MSKMNDIFQVDYLPDIAKKEMIEINEQTTTKVEYPKCHYFCDSDTDNRPYADDF